jgi:hypothetical protein
MPDIIEKRTPKTSSLTCGCGGIITSSHYWEVDCAVVCDKCYDDNYAHLVKCKVKGCKEHDELSKFFNGKCPSCDEET